MPVRTETKGFGSSTGPTADAASIADIITRSPDENEAAINFIPELAYVRTVWYIPKDICLLE